MLISCYMRHARETRRPALSIVLTASPHPTPPTDEAPPTLSSQNRTDLGEAATYLSFQIGCRRRDLSLLHCSTKWFVAPLSPLFVLLTQNEVERRSGNATIRFVALAHKTDLDSRSRFFTIRFVTKRKLNYTKVHGPSRTATVPKYA